MKECKGNGYDIDHCRVEKRGCPGCDHYKEEGEENNEQKISKYSKDKGD